MAPALFASEHFPALRSLRGDVGAREVIEAHMDDVATVLAEGISDLDTMADYLKYLSLTPTYLELRE